MPNHKTYIAMNVGIICDSFRWTGLIGAQYAHEVFYDTRQEQMVLSLCGTNQGTYIPSRQPHGTTDPCKYNPCPGSSETSPVSLLRYTLGKSGKCYKGVFLQIQSQNLTDMGYTSDLPTSM
jgi:hypothetical protein